MISKRIYRQKLWEKKRVPIMKAILKAKVEQVKEVKDALLNTGSNIICEAVYGDGFWSCGLGKDEASKTDPSSWPGENRLGRLWMEIRDELEEEMKKKDLYTSVTNKKDSKRKHSQEAASCTPTASKVRDGKNTPPKDQKSRNPTKSRK